MALTTKSTSPLTHFNQAYYNNLKRNVSMKAAEEYRIKVTKKTVKAIDLGQPGAIDKISELKIRGQEEQKKEAEKAQEDMRKREETGEVVNLGKDPKAAESNSTDPEAGQKSQQAKVAQEIADEVAKPVDLGSEENTDLAEKPNVDTTNVVDKKEETEEVNNKGLEEVENVNGDAPTQEELAGTEEKPVDLGAVDHVADDEQEEEIAGDEEEPTTQETPTGEEETVAITLPEVRQLLKDNNIKFFAGIKYEQAIAKAQENGLL